MTNADQIEAYVDAVISGEKIACREVIQACERYRKDRENPAWDFREDQAELAIRLTESMFVHQKGEDLEGHSLKNRPLRLEPWQKFIFWNLFGFFEAGRDVRRYQEAFIMVARKNGKTALGVALAWAAAAMSGNATVYVVGSVMKQAKQSFDFMQYSLKKQRWSAPLRFRNNNQEMSIDGEYLGGRYIHFEALAANPDRLDSLNANAIIADELHAYRTPTLYNVMKESMKANRNKLMIGITTGGSDMNSFCYRRREYCRKVLAGTAEAERYFIFIAKADEDADGWCDYTNPIELEKANPNVGVSVTMENLIEDATQAQDDPQQRKDFLAKSLNVYTGATNSYFDLGKIKASDRLYSWTLEELKDLPVKWYGGADLSKMHDLTAAALYGTYGSGEESVDIIIPHAFFPRAMAEEKARDDGIPLFGWEEDGWLTMSNTDTVHYSDVVKWFKQMRKMGFKIREIGFDRKFGNEFYLAMKKSHFRIVEQKQLYVLKSQGFRRIERKALEHKLYYCHAEPWEYCTANVHAVEMDDDAIKYGKLDGKSGSSRIDVFDASVFAAVRMLENMGEKKKSSYQLNGITKTNNESENL